MVLVAALAATGHDAEAREALQRYLALPSTGRSKRTRRLTRNPDPPHAGPRYADAAKRWNEGVRKAGLPEK